MDCIICRYAELALKGKNRGLFEKQLVRNISACLRQNNISAKIEKIRGRIFVFSSDKKALSFLKYVFGIASLSGAVSVDNDIEKIKSSLADYLNGLDSLAGIRSFRITTKRSNKEFFGSSRELDSLLGDFVSEAFHWKVDLKNPDINMGVEVYHKTFIFHEKISCFGGLPLGISGSVACILRNDNDLAAAWLVMKRGCSIFPVSFSDFDVSVLEKYSFGSDISLRKINSISDINGIVSSCSCKAVVIGDFFEGFDSSVYSEISAQILTPLIAYDYSQKEDLLRMIS